MERILLVDDEKSIVFAVSAYFKRHGFCVDCAADPSSARLFLRERSYELAIVDVHLVSRAACDGLELAEVIRRESPDTAVILMTALDTPETEQRAAALGVHSFLRKPAPLAQLASVAFSLIGRRAAAVTPQAV